MSDDSPTLFELPDQPHLVERCGRFLHTGKIRGRDAALVEEVCRWVLSGASKSLIARKFGISRQTVTALIRKAEELGKLVQFKVRLAGDLFDLADVCQSHFRDQVEAGKVPANVLMVGAGIALDKALALTGQASQIVEHKRTVTIDVSAGFEALAAGSVVDCASTVSTAQPVDAQRLLPESCLVDTAIDTTPAPDPAAAQAIPAPGAPGEGGGVAIDRGGEMPDRFPAGKFCAQRGLPEDQTNANT